MKHVQTYKIRENECDSQYKIRLAALWDIMQDAAEEHAEMLGVGHNEMRQTGLFFALSRMNCEIFRYPLSQEKIKVETYPNGYEKLYAIRDYNVYDVSGNLLAKARSNWIILSIDNLKIARPEKAYPEFFNIKSEGMLLEKIDINELEYDATMTNSKKIRAEFYDIDPNNHVNNSRYIAWLENQLCERKISYINTNYQNEVKLHEELEIMLSDHKFALKNSGEKVSFIADFKCFA